jgi:hypothetical protein
MILIHASHEAGFKVGGIGAVLDGLLSAPSYLESVARTFVVGPMRTHDALEMERLLAPRNQLYIYYFADRGFINCPPALTELLSGIERAFGVRLLYGKRKFGSAEHEIVLVDADDVNPARLENFNYFVWEKFGLDAWRYQNEPEFTQHMAAAEPALAALRQILEIGDSRKDASPSPASNRQSPPIILCHEFMGLPLWYAAATNYPGQYKSAFVAHEVASVRPIVEGHAGHDTRFYNVMRHAAGQGRFLEDVFGDQSWNFKHAMLKTAEHCDYVLAVGDPVVEELRFLSPGFKHKRIDLTYNGTPSKGYDLTDIAASSEKLRSYARTLTGLHPRFIFSHVTRMVISKALWRDIRVMEQLDWQLAERGESAVLFMLSSVKPQGRSSAEAQAMNREYGWPARHRYGWPDLVDFEASLYDAIAHFNSWARASRIVLINQFGFSRDRCGDSMPADLSFEDLRRGTDLEFGQSIYEPFGIAQVEPLSSGALCVVSDVCGCVGFVRHAIGVVRLGMRAAERQQPITNVIMGEYTHVPSWQIDPMQIGQYQRDEAERNAAHTVAQLIVQSLPRDAAAKERLVNLGYALASRMSWDVVAQEQLLPALTRA